MVSAVEYNVMRKRNGLSLVRFDVRKLSAQDLLDLRHAFEGMYEISATEVGDSRGYAAIARGHGYDEALCHNPRAPFLPWHRAYMYHFEKNLTDGLRYKRANSELVITMPWWDWTAFDPETDTVDGLPKAFEDETYIDPTEANAVKPNPLRRALSLYRSQSLRATGDNRFTARHPSNFRSIIPTLGDLVAKIMPEKDFMKLAGSPGRIEQPHNLVHGYVGGTGDPVIPNPQTGQPPGPGDMGMVTSASFDPIFWLHHMFVDKLWFDWQTEHGNDSVPRSIRALPMYGGMLGETTLDSEGNLKITYGSQPLAAAGHVIRVESGTEEAPLPPTMRVPLSTLRHHAKNIERAELHFQGMRPPKSSCSVRVFVNAGACDETTPTKGNPTYAGSLHIFGHGGCFGAKGHCNPSLAKRDAYDLRAPHHFTSTNYSIDVTEALRTLSNGLASARGSVDVELAFVVVDVRGSQMNPEEIDVDHISITLE